MTTELKVASWFGTALCKIPKEQTSGPLKLSRKITSVSVTAPRPENPPCCDVILRTFADFGSLPPMTAIEERILERRREIDAQHSLMRSVIECSSQGKLVPEHARPVDDVSSHLSGRKEAEWQTR